MTEKKRILPVLIIAALALFVLVFCAGCDKKAKGRTASLTEMEAQDGEVSRKRIDELKKNIQAARKDLDRSVSAGVNLGDYYRSLGLEYMALEMYGLALESFQAAMEIYPTSPVLFYYAGVCAGQTAKSQMDPQEHQNYLLLAEEYYKRALASNPAYGDAAYALGVLYQFELNQPREAESVLNNLLVYQPDNLSALFLMAGVKVTLGNREEAVAYYEKIAAVSKDEETKNTALANRDILLGRN